MANEKDVRVVELPTWHSLSSNEVLDNLGISRNGLTTSEARQRFEKYGANELARMPRPGFLTILWGQLNNFVVILLIIASIISAFLGETLDAGAIMAIVILNTAFGIIQERRAENALAALKKLAAPEARVLRDGHRITIPGRELVPGDIVYLDAGNFVPADLRLIEAVNLRVEEASLTGESLAVQKNADMQLEPDAPLGDRKNSAFMGTTVSFGRGSGVVTSTGMHTQLGLIASMLQSIETEETPLQRRLNELGKFLSLAALAMVALVFVITLFYDTNLAILLKSPLTYFNTYAKPITNAFMIAISLAIAAVPEGLPAVVTISLALGMQEMIHRHALIRKLSSVETLGSATTICSDKTGTLTQNQMTVKRLWAANQFIEVTGNGYAADGEFLDDGGPVSLDTYPAILTTLWLGLINNDAGLTKQGDSIQVIGDPTEAALIVAAEKAGALHAELNSAYPRENEIPFDSERKRMVTIHHVADPKTEDPSPFNNDSKKGWRVIAVKGAPDVVLKLCNHYQTKDDKSAPLDQNARDKIMEANNIMTSEALRVLGVAYRVIHNIESDPQLDNLEQELIFVGLIGMIDPPREEVKIALVKARRAGIRTIMITGDFPNTARAIAETIGLLRPGKKVMTGAELDTTNDAELFRLIEDVDVFARVSPEHKMRIVVALQANNEVVAMTGDGVNDAPAIKRADIGIAMGITGTDVAKETADMVLTDDNYASIVSAVAQGRIIYSNIRKFVFFLLSSNVTEILVIFLATLAGFPPPLTAIQLLWLNLITDGAPALALAMEKGDPDIMDSKPRPRQEPILNGSMRIGIIIQTIVQTSVVLTAFCTGLLWELTATGSIPPLGQSGLLFLLRFNWSTVNLDVLRTAETMAFVTLSLCELFRAYTVRSERASLFQIGVFSNKTMQFSVGISISLLLLVCLVPFLQNIFNVHWMSAMEWATVIGLGIIPAITEEITKFFIRQHKS